MTMKSAMVATALCMLTGCSLLGKQSYQDESGKKLEASLDQYKSKKFVMVKNPDYLTQQDKEQLAIQGYTILKADRVSAGEYLVSPSGDKDAKPILLTASESEDNLLEREGVHFRILEQVELAKVKVDSRLETLPSLASKVTKTGQTYGDNQQSEEKSGQTVTEASSSLVTALQNLEAMPKLHWKKGETLKQCLTRWVEKTGYENLVWYVKDKDGDLIDIPISSNHTFVGELEDTLRKIKKAYATAPINPIILDFTIKRGNKSIIVTNSGARI